MEQVVFSLFTGLVSIGISIMLVIMGKRARLPIRKVVYAFALLTLVHGSSFIFYDIQFFRYLTYLVVTCVFVYAAYNCNTMVSNYQTMSLREERRIDLENQVRIRTQELTDAINIRDTFLSVASHELKTPLTSLKLQTQLRMRSHPDEKYFRNMDVQIVRLTNLVDDMLDISHIQRGEFRLNRGDHDIHDIIQTSADNFRGLIESKHGQLIIGPLVHRPINIDKYRIEQVLDNLLTNAIKYAAGTLVSISAQNKTDSILICVKDQGPGINPDLQDKIFGKFERATHHNEVSGLGLGLYISKTIIEAHHGRIWVESHPGTGSTFFVELLT